MQSESNFDEPQYQRDFSEDKIYYERNLPHYQLPGATLFITFRLAGSLPREIIIKLNDELQRRKESLEKNEPVERIKEFRKQYQNEMFDRWDKALDFHQGGPRWLSIDSVAELVWEALHYRDGKNIAWMYVVLCQTTHI